LYYGISQFVGLLKISLLPVPFPVKLEKRLSARRKNPVTNSAKRKEVYYNREIGNKGNRNSFRKKEKKKGTKNTILHPLVP
jgi:hypothetical protein